VRMPLWLLPVRALLWLIGFISIYKSPFRVTGQIRKELAILKKRMKHWRKAIIKGRVPKGQPETRADAVEPGIEDAGERTRRAG
jgi:hypothetical protein